MTERVKSGCLSLIERKRFKQTFVKQNVIGDKIKAVNAVLMNLVKIENRGFGRLAARPCRCRNKQRLDTVIFNLAVKRGFFIVVG